jgi:hypothetical protein
MTAGTGNSSLLSARRCRPTRALLALPLEALTIHAHSRNAVPTFLKNLWTDWAREWGLRHHPEKGWLYRTEYVIGERNGLLFRAGWGTQENPGLIVAVRFPCVADLGRLRQTLIEDATLDSLPGKGKARGKMVVEDTGKKMIRIGERPEFFLTNTCLLWRRTFAFRTPKAAEVEAWVDTLVSAIARTTPGFNGRCETCATGTTRQYVVVDNLPAMICATCLQRMKADGEMADRAYDMKEARYLPGATLALLAAVAGAGAWAGIAALTDRIFAIAAIGIGALVAWAYRMGADRVDLAGRVIAAFLTVASVMMGEILLFSWWAARANPDLGFNLDAGWYVYLKTWATRPKDEIMPLFLGLVGAWFATQVLQRPKLKATIETGGPEASERQAA